MRLLLAVASLWAVAVFALRGDQTRVRYTEVDDRDVEVFRSGQTYKYRLDTQISSGMASISDQHAATRLRAEAQIHFQSDRLVSLKLKDIIVATTNQEIQEPEEVQPIQMFKDAEIKQEELRQLELPCEFDYVDGLVERVRFNPQDQPWSKNIKKSVLNMLQLNLKQRKGQEAQLEQPEKWQKEREQQDQLSGKDAQQQQQKSRMFVMPETTLEGECQVTYTMNPVNARAKFNSYYDEQVSSSSVKLFNVTKTVDFHRCSKIADIRYGPKIEKPCANCTAQLEELEERKLDRTTIMRHVVVGSPDKYGIKRVETVSHYVFKTLNVEEETPMRTIVAARLSLVRADSGDREQIERELKRIETNGAKEESLLYSVEFDKKEKLFYMFGDDEFPQQAPFEKVQDKVGKIETALKKLAGMWSDKTKGIESEATLVFTRLVELLRMSSQEELKDAYSKAKNHARQSSETEVQVNTHEILVDALANAGTLNAIKLLADKIKRGDIEPTRATRAISLLYFPAPSEKQAKTLTELCEQGACKEHEPCRQVCWLTAGTLYGQLCDDALTVDDAIEQLKPQCHQQLKKDFVSKVMQLVDSYETRYKKIVLLKALGNAGLEPSVPELEKIIRNPREDPVVRMQAIDSLRRLRAVMPQKIQRVLLPVFQNVRERPEVRMMALSQVLATFPEGPIVDQIGYALLREPCRQVKSYVYKAMQQLSESPIEIEKELARHLKSVLKLAGITEEEEETLVRGSRYYRIPVYSQAKREGFLVDFESMFGQDNLLPKHLTVGLDTVFNGLFKKNALELSFTQEDIEQWFEKLMDVYMDFSYGMRKSESSLRGNRRSSDESSENDNSDFLKSIKSLGIKRRSSSSERRVDSDSRSRNNAPYAMLNVRYGDVDYAVIPLEEEFLPRPLKEIVTRGRQPTIGDLKDLIESIKGRSFSAQGAMNLLENSVKIPTSAGFPLRMWHVIPVLASVEGRVQVELDRDQLKAGIKIHPMVSATHLKRVEVWSPIVHTGVDTTRTVSVNLPVNTQLQVELRDKTFKWTVDVPTKEFRAINIHTLPLTYVTDAEWTQPRTPLVKRIENRELVHRAQHIDTVVGKKHFGTPLKINGEVHFPQQYTYPSIVRALLSTENHLHVEFQPQEDTPRKIVITGEGKLFEPTDAASAMHSQLKNFHSKSRFDREMDDHYSGSEDDERQFNRFIDDYQPKKLYKHQASFEIKTVGGSKDKQAQMEIEAVCDTQHRYVKAQLKAKRSPIQPYDESNSQWTMRAEAQAVLPDVHSSMQEYKRQNGEKQQRLVAKIESEWGQSDRKQKISVNINGEQGRNPEWRQKISELERRSESADSQKLRQQMIQKAAFINKYDISADYENLSPETKNTMGWLSTALKSWNFMNTNVESRKSASRSADGQITAQVVIDPITHEHANVTLKTPSEIVRVDSMSLPIKIKPFTLVKPGQVQIAVESFSDIVRDYAAESGRECKVSSRKIRSFDDVLFKAPLTKCYSVLAKDCRSEQPRFAVLMKKIDSESKAIKVISKGKTIEVEPKEGKLVVKINGKKVTDEERLQDYGVDYNKNLVRIATRDVTVRFDGQEATVKIADSHKNTQCGLCGHYDDDSDDEFRMSNNELTSDLKSYQKSYSILDDECTPDFEETHRREEYKQLKKNNRKGGFWDSDEDEEEYERKQQKQNRRKNNDNDEIEPIEKTETMEYNHKICFSVKPVKTCPEEAYPSGTKEMKVGFTCLDRSSSEARRLLREAQRSDAPISLPSTKPSFVETITIPSACVVY